MKPGDRIQTKANGLSSESGKTCISERICSVYPTGLTETVGAAGHSVTFAYRGASGHYRTIDAKPPKADANWSARLPRGARNVSVRVAKDRCGNTA